MSKKKRPFFKFHFSPYYANNTWISCFGNSTSPPLFNFLLFKQKKMKLRCTVRKMSFFVRKVKLSTRRSTKTWKTFRCFVVHFTNILAFLVDENMILRSEIDINISRKKSEKSRTFAICRVSKNRSPHFSTLHIF